ncbi:DUF4140 domain-containing protein [Geotalea sp. SG265]|uniref:DUF4140 domain-containing protein n=1 Tax=Geotalea sp. SG265 TaxID=2922867 RepID=UPI001FAEDFA7|nr:DUF4140 domain-containing protein [Geotalea sp. SG265]
MIKNLSAVAAAVLLALPAFAADRSVTLFLDGARVEQAATAAKGYAEISLPPSVLPGSLRVRPPAGAAIDRVETVAVTTNPKQRQQLEKLAERRDQLEDRLKALATRERIFTAAAKSQSGKAPRKTKNNPEPLAAIRQGTEFAIAQLEGVYQAKRKTEKELKIVQARLETVEKAANIGGSKVRIWLKGKGGKVTASYLVPDMRWLPVYDFRASERGTVQVVQRASFPTMEQGTTVAVVPRGMAEAAQFRAVELKAFPFQELTAQTLPAQNLTLADSPQPALSFSLTNTSPGQLPPGEAVCYYRGEYLGRFSFAGLNRGETVAVSCGK